MLIDKKRSIIPACDVYTDSELIEFVKATHEHPSIGAYKIGITTALYYGLSDICKAIRGITNKPIIYDHQKAGNDIPEMGENFARTCVEAGVDAVILFPFVGAVSQEAWQEACLKIGLYVIVGGEMTHPGFEGYIPTSISIKIYSIAASNEITDFVVPGNKTHRIKEYKTFLEEGYGINPIFYSPGLITQGGDLSESGKVAGERWHAIVGRALYTANDPLTVLDTLSKQL